MQHPLPPGAGVTIQQPETACWMNRPSYTYREILLVPAPYNPWQHASTRRILHVHTLPPQRQGSPSPQTVQSSVLQIPTLLYLIPTLKDYIKDFRPTCIAYAKRACRKACSPSVLLCSSVSLRALVRRRYCAASRLSPPGVRSFLISLGLFLADCCTGILLVFQ